MLALTTTDALTLIDPTTLKNAPSSVPSCQTLLSRPTASIWHPNNSSLFISSFSDIHKYDLSTNSFHHVHSMDTTDPISHLLVKDKGGTLIFSVSQVTHVLECSSGKITQSFDSHKSPITSLSLSNDCTLLATTSSGTAHVHNLTHGSHTILRGLPSTRINTCVFHTHLRTRLLLASGRQLFVYDTTRPSGPIKMIPMSEGTMGEIDFVACSPFSKTLVAFATTAGSVFLVDLEKEKAIFRTVNIRIPLTCLAFSPEGGSLYLGTENGKLSIVDLRALDKLPKLIVISETGARVENMCIQKKVKAVVEPSTQSTGATSTKQSTQQEPIRRATSTTAPKPTAAKSGGKTKNAAAFVREGEKANPSPRTNPGAKRKVLGPIKDPLGNSGAVLHAESPGGNFGRKDIVPALRDPTSPISKISASSTRTSTVEISGTRRRGSGATASAKANGTTSPVLGPSRVGTGVGSRPSSRGMSSSPPRSGLSLPRGSCARQIHTPPVKPTRHITREGSSSSTSTNSSVKRPKDDRTPSPDLPNIDADLGVHEFGRANIAAKKTGMSLLGLDTPEVDKWIMAGKKGVDKRCERKGKKVGFKDDSEGDERPQEDAVKVDEKESKRNPSRALQISPPRPPTLSQAPSTHADGTDSGVNPHAFSTSAPDLLRTIVRDVMYDFQRETKAEIRGLHLDLVRMGRGWRHELRSLMEEYAGDLGHLREENTRLREENARLRAGR